MTKSTGKRNSVKKGARQLSDRPDPKQAVNWQFTIFDWTDAELAAMQALEGIAMQFVREVCPSTGRKHLQGVAQFPAKVVRSTCQTTILPARAVQVSARPCYAKLANNLAYTSKENTREPGTPVYNVGKFSHDENESSDSNSRARVLLDLAEAGDWKTLRADHPAAWLYQKRQLVAARASKLLIIDKLDGVLDNLWIYGKAGRGKDQYADSIAPGAFSKAGNTKWWCGYDGQPDVILRDVGPSVRLVMDEFKLWTDRYKFHAEWKGAGFEIRPRRMVVTSQYMPKDLGLDKQTLEALERRFQFVVVCPDGKARYGPRDNIERPPLAVREDVASLDEWI